MKILLLTIVLVLTHVSSLAMAGHDDPPWREFSITKHYLIPHFPYDPQFSGAVKRDNLAVTTG